MALTIASTPDDVSVAFLELVFDVAFGGDEAPVVLLAAMVVLCGARSFDRICSTFFEEGLLLFLGTWGNRSFHNGSLTFMPNML